jgi:RNA polymerase sigma factor (sigma-70 family)
MKGETMTVIGVAGLGRMGGPVCVNLVRAGYAVQAGDREPAAAERAARCGAGWVPDMARLAAGADVLVTVLPGPAEVREVMLGAGGAAAALRPGTTWIDMTSNSPAAMTEVRDAVLGRGVRVLDAPAGGGVAAAQRGSLQLLVGGEAQVVAEHRELLEILGSPGRVVHAGGYGAGYTANACAGFHRFEPGTNVHAWLHRTQAIAFFSTYRARQHGREIPAETPGTAATAAGKARSAENIAPEAMPGTRVRQALLELPPDQRLAVYLSDVEGFRYAEIADIMQVPVSAVTSRLHRGRSRLRARLESQARSS